MTSSITAASLCLLLLLLPSLLSAAAPSGVWPAYDRPVRPVHSPVANHRQPQQQHRHVRLPASASPTPAEIWSGFPLTIATFPVNGNSSSWLYGVAPLYSAKFPMPIRVQAVDPKTGALANGSYDVPPGYQPYNLLATVTVVVLHLKPLGDSNEPDSIHVLDARSLQLLTSYDLDYPLAVLGINAAGDTIVTAILGGHEAATQHVMTGKRIAVYDAGRSDLIVFGAALHPTSGVVHIWNGSDSGDFNLLSLAANNTLLSSFPLQLDSLTATGSISLDLSAQFVFVLYATRQNIVQQYQISTGQRTFSLPLDQLRVGLTQFLSPAWTAGAALTVNALEQTVLVLDKNGPSPPLMVGGRPTLLGPDDVALLPSAEGSGDYTVLVTSTSGPRAVYELDQQSRLLYQYLTGDDADCRYPQHVTADAEGRVYVPYCNDTVTVFDGRSHRPLYKFSIGQGNILVGLVAGPNDTVFYLGSNSPAIVQQHIVTGAIVATLSVTPGNSLQGLTYDPRNQTLWTTDLGFETSSSLYQLSLTGQILTNLSCPSAVGTGDASPSCWEIAVDPAHDRLLVAQYDITFNAWLLWLDAGTGKVLDQYLFSRDGARAIAVSENGSRLYVVDGRDAVYVFEPQA